jgi:hypothetical protein
MTKKLAAWWPLLLLAGITFALSLVQYWKGDAVLCQFINYIPQGTADDYRLIRSWSDILESQQSFYTTANGRVLLQVVIQIFATQLPKWLFAAVNALMYVVLALVTLQLGKLDSTRWQNVLLVSGLIFMAFDMDFYDPPFQMSYVWAFALVGWWMLLYRRADKVNAAVLLLVGILAGASQEALTVGVLGALGMDALTRRFRLTVAQWCGIIGFAVGTAALCLAPGNFVRLGQSAAAPLSQRIIHIAIHSQLTLFTALVLLLQLAMRKVKLRGFFVENRMVIYAWVVLLAFNVVIGKCSDRQVLGLEFCSLLLLCSLLRGRRVAWLAVVCGVAAVAVGIARYHRLALEAEACTEIAERYATSTDGKVVISTPTYIHGRGIVNSATRLKQAQCDSARFHPLSLIPEELADIDMEFSGHTAVSTAYGVTYVVQSLGDSVPAYERTSVMGRQLWRKQVKFAPEGEIAGAQWHYAIASGNVEF